MSYTETAYDAAVAALFERHQSVQYSGFSDSSYKPGLQSMRDFDSVLGNPSSAIRCIHVAGTNGKGSVSSIIAAALASNGYTVGLYTSPHLLDFRERIKIVSESGYEMIPKTDVFDFIGRYGGSFNNLSFFEITTGLAFHWFAARRPDFVVLESGLGGRLDSTNIVTPLLSVVTSIGLDHCAILGPTRTAIAGEKAGIFKPGVPAVVSSEDPETGPVFRSFALESGAPLFFADSEDSGVDENRILGSMDLTGPCQKQNLHTSLVALKMLGQITPGCIRGIERASALTGLRGRWEQLRLSPCVIADIGHNPPALELNFARLEKICRPETGRRLAVVFGIMKDKDLDSIAPMFPSYAAYFVSAPKTPRAMTPDELACRLSRLRPELPVSGYPDVAEAIESAIDYAGRDGLVYIGGSAFVVAEALAYFQ